MQAAAGHKNVVDRIRASREERHVVAMVLTGRHDEATLIRLRRAPEREVDSIWHEVRVIRRHAERWRCVVHLLAAVKDEMRVSERRSGGSEQEALFCSRQVVADHAVSHRCTPRPDPECQRNTHVLAIREEALELIEAPAGMHGMSNCKARRPALGPRPQRGPVKDLHTIVTLEAQVLRLWTQARGHAVPQPGVDARGHEHQGGGPGAHVPSQPEMAARTFARLRAPTRRARTPTALASARTLSRPTPPPPTCH